MTNETESVFNFKAGDEDVGMRIDFFLSGMMDDASRSFIKKLIKGGRVSLNGDACERPSRHVAPGDRIEVRVPPPPRRDLTPENIPLDILHEDAHLLIVNKPSGLVVHPAPGHYTGTLVHAVLYHCADFQLLSPTHAQGAEEVLRPGIVHRLDRFTSGVMVVAKNEQAFGRLAKQARDHAFDRRYLALVRGEFKEEAGRINATIGRSLADRSRMTVTGIRGREAITRFKVLERFGVASLVSLQLETGRTHQIRVHLRFAGRPVLGDPVYGVTEFNGWQVDDGVKRALDGLEGQALHAELLGLDHPDTGERMTFTAPPPADFNAALDALRTGDAG